MLRSELAAEGIDVSTLCPGVVNTNLDETSAKNRPARFGGPMPHPKELDLPVRMAPEAVGPIVIAGIRANRPYIFSHPSLVEMIERFKIEPVLRDFEFYKPMSDF
jgi:short-subunit dehydrogenase